MTPRGQKVRLAFLMVLVVGGYGLLAKRLIFLHTGDHDQRVERTEIQREKRNQIPAPRGSIMDRNGNMLAVDRRVHHLAVDPQFVHNNADKSHVAAWIMERFAVDPATIGSALSRTGTQFQMLQRFISDEGAEQVRALNREIRAQKKKDPKKKFPEDGIVLEVGNARRYAAGNLASQIVGYASSAGRAAAGIELSMDEFLKGRPGVEVTARSGSGSEIAMLRRTEIPAQPGADIELTIDQFVQFPVERALDAAVEKYDPVAAWAIVMRVATGEILAMVSKPDHDPNTGYDFNAPYRFNHNITTLYEPGSTIKALCVAAALQEGVVSRSTMIDCEGGLWSYGGRSLKDVFGYGLLTVDDVLKKSSNIGTAKIALALGNEKLETYYRKFGLGERTGIELPLEERGIFAPRSRWSNISATRLAMGHEISVPALQVLNAINTIANDGFRMQPTIVRRIINHDGTVRKHFTPQVLGRVIDARTSLEMRRMMGRVTEKDGTGRLAAIDHCRIAGKTGTAQKPLTDGRGYSKTDYVASFVGFFPVERPEVSMIIVVDTPRKGGTIYGGAIAGPLFREIALQLVNYFNIPPDPEPMQVNL